MTFFANDTFGAFVFPVPLGETRDVVAAALAGNRDTPSR